MFEYFIEKLNDTNYDETVILGTLLVILESNVDKYIGYFDSQVFGSSQTVFKEDFQPEFDGIFGDTERNIFTDVVAKMLLDTDVIVDMTFSFKDFTIVFDNKRQTFEQKFINLAQVFYEMQFCGDKLMDVTGVSELKGIHEIMVIVENILMAKQKSLQVVYFNNKYFDNYDRMKAEEFPSSNVDFQRVRAVKDLKKKMSVPTSSDIKHQIIILDDPKMEVDKINNLMELCNVDTVMILVGIDEKVINNNEFVHIKKVNAAPSSAPINGGADMCNYMDILIKQNNLAKNSVISTANYNKLINMFKTKNNDKLQKNVGQCLTSLGYTVANDCDPVLKALEQMVRTNVLKKHEILDLAHETNLDTNKVKSCIRTFEDKYTFEEDSLVETPTLLSVSNNGNKEQASSRIRYVADVNQVNDKGQTKLYIASENGHKDVVEVLIAKGAKVDQANKEGYTPVTIAVLKNHEGVLDVIMQQLTEDCQSVLKTIIDQKLAIGRHIMYNSKNTIETELNTIEEKNINECLSKLGYIVPPDDSCDILLDALRDLLKDIKHSTIYQEDYDKLLTKLKITEQSDKTQLKDCLENLRYRVYLSSTSEETKNSLLKAIENRDGFAVERLILTTVFKIDDPIRGGDTPLFIASHYGYKNIVEILVDKGADVNKNNNDGKTPLMAASRFKDVVDYLMKHGAKEVQSFESSANIKETGVANRSSPQVFDSDNFLLKLTQQLIDKGGYAININDFSDIVSFFDKKQIGNNYEIQPITRSGNEFKFDPETGEKDDSEHTYYEFSLKGQLDESTKVVNIYKFGKVMNFMGGAPKVPITLKIRLKVPKKKEEEEEEPEEEEPEEEEPEEEEPQTPIDPLKKLFGMYHGCDYKLYEFNGEISDEEFTGDNLDTIVRYVIFSNIVVYVQS
jgi:ankyrin repeat protein